MYWLISYCINLLIDGIDGIIRWYRMVYQSRKRERERKREEKVDPFTRRKRKRKGACRKSRRSVQ